MTTVFPGDGTRPPRRRTRGRPPLPRAASSRVVAFPPDRSLGVLCVRASRPAGEPPSASGCSWSSWRDIGPARGRIVVPAGRWLGLKVGHSGARDLSPLRDLGPDDLQAISLARSGVDGSQMAHLKGLTGLEVVDLWGTGVCDGGVAHLAGLTQLSLLDLWGTGVTASGLAALTGLRRLRRLYLPGRSIDDAALESLAPLTSLQQLDLSGSHVTDAAGPHLARLTGLRSLYLWGTAVGDETVERVARLSRLRELDLGRTQVSDRGLRCLHALPSLRSLYLWETSVSESAVAEIRAALPDCYVYAPDHREHEPGHLATPPEAAPPSVTEARRGIVRTLRCRA